MSIAIETLRKMQLIHNVLKPCLPVKASQIHGQPWAGDYHRRTWTRVIAALRELGAPIEYWQLENDAVYKYTHKWDFWRAVREAVELRQDSQDQQDGDGAD